MGRLKDEWHNEVNELFDTFTMEMAILYDMIDNNLEDGEEKENILSQCRNIEELFS
jgi:hypothetical protein